MRKENISGLAPIVVIVVIVIIAVAILVAVDATRTAPANPQETCTLVHHLVLPDNCVCSVAGRTCSPFTTRPYLFFWKQAATCGTLCDVDLR